MGICNCSMFCCTLLYVHSTIAIILMGKRELVALLNLSSWCLAMVERLFLVVPQGCMRFVIVVFPNHTHLLFLLVTQTTLLEISCHGSNILRVITFCLSTFQSFAKYSKTCLKWPLKKRTKIGFQDRLSLNADQQYPREHSAILSTFIRLPFVFKIFVLSSFERPFKTGFTVK